MLSTQNTIRRYNLYPDLNIRIDSSQKLIEKNQILFEKQGNDLVLYAENETDLRYNLSKRSFSFIKNNGLHNVHPTMFLSASRNKFHGFCNLENNDTIRSFFISSWITP